ncbi:O-antigen ligase family protein [Niallia circulans]|uniref:O-antigen ligase family protein n=1 Tax=Niallia circulans TaxID=1397 RepID=UPI0035151ED1
MKENYKLVIGILLITTISWHHIFRIEIAGFDLLSVYKLVLLFLLTYMIIKNKNKFNIMYVLMISAITLLFIFSIIYSKVVPSGSAAIAFKSYLGIVTPFLIFFISLDSKKKQYSISILRLLCYLPFVSLFCGIIFSIFTDWSFIVQEYTGVMRLGGANSPAHFSELTFISLCSSLFLFLTQTNKRRYLLLSSINFILIILAFTRTTLLCSLLMLFPLYVYVFKRMLQYSLNYFFVFITFSLGALLSLIYIVPVFIERTFNTERGEIDTSGREYAWRYFIEKGNEFPIFGRGFGASEILYPNHPYKGFLAPHNEYVRFYLETGIVGLLLFFIILFMILLSVSKNIYKEYQFLLFPISLIISFAFYTYFDNTITTPQFIVPFLFLIKAISDAIKFNKYHRSLINE